MASSSSSAGSPASPKRTKRKQLSNHLDHIIAGVDTLIAFAKAFGNNTEITITLNSEMYNAAGSAQALAVRRPDGNYDVKLVRADLSKARDDLHKLIKSGTLDLYTELRKRDPSARTISGFGNPRRFKPEMLNFLRGAPPLTSVTASMGNLKEGISSQGIVTALMTSYSYDKTSPGHASLVYHSGRNIGAIGAYLAAVKPQLGAQYAALPADQRAILDGFEAQRGPEGVSTAVVEAALRSVGIDGNTKIKAQRTNPDGSTEEVEEKVVNGQFIGADRFMREQMPTALAALADKRGSDPSNLRFADLQTITSLNFVDDPGKEFAMPAAEKKRYIDIIVPPAKRFAAAAKAAKDLIGKAKSTDVQIRNAYQNVLNNVVDYGALAGAMGSLGPQTTRRIGLDSESQNVKLFRLKNDAMAKHHVAL